MICGRGPCLISFYAYYYIITGLAKANGGAISTFYVISRRKTSHMLSNYQRAMLFAYILHPCSLFTHLVVWKLKGGSKCCGSIFEKRNKTTTNQLNLFQIGLFFVVNLHKSLLAFIALSAAQSSAQTRIHNAILVIDTSNNASYNQVHWLVRTPYLSIKASNGYKLIGLSSRPIPMCFFVFQCHLQHRRGVQCGNVFLNGQPKLW